MNFRYDYGTKEGIRSSSVVLSQELRDEIDAMYGRGQRSAFLERAGWLLLAMLEYDKEGVDQWIDWFEKAASNKEYNDWWDSASYITEPDPISDHDE